MVIRQHSSPSPHENCLVKTKGGKTHSDLICAKITRRDGKSDFCLHEFFMGFIFCFLLLFSLYLSHVMGAESPNVLILSVCGSPKWGKNSVFCS